MFKNVEHRPSKCRRYVIKSARRPKSLLCLEPLEDRTLLSLTPGTGVPGFVASANSFPSSISSSAQAVVVQPDGSYVVAASVVSASSDDLGLVRYIGDGSLDTNFGVSGFARVQIAAPSTGRTVVTGIALQPDGKILVVGPIDLARFTSSGALDSTFGNGGLVSLSNSAQGLALQPDGKILVVGTNLERFTSTGMPDTSFGTNGVVTLSGAARGVALQSDGRIVVAGSSLVRFNADGSNDPTFGTMGQINLSFPANGLALQVDGRIVVAGSVPDPSTSFMDFAVARFNSNGTADATFGNGGEVITSLSIDGTHGKAVNSVLVQPDDKIVVLGLSEVPFSNGGFNNNFTLVRYNPNGTLDSTYDRGGISQEQGGVPTAMALHPANSEIVVVGGVAGDPHLHTALFTADMPISDPNARFVTQIYLDLLQRQPDSGGLAAWVAQLQANSTPTQVVIGIESSQEYEMLQVERLYGLLLNRPADTSGLTTWTNFLSQGGTFEQLEAILIGSDEYFSVRGGGSNTTFLQRVYFDMLQRPIDSVGAMAWANALTSGTSRTMVAADILGSLESDTDEVEALYHQLLRRAADPIGLSAFTNALQHGTTNEAVIALIAGSNEYFGRF